VATVSLKSLVKRYGDAPVIHGITLDVTDGEFVVLVGPSGCSKSTTLRMIAGLEKIRGGSVDIGGRVVNDLEPKGRNIAMVFQNDAIYPHMTVRRNIGFGLRTSKLPRADKERRIDEVAALLGMTDYLDRKFAALSGGGSASAWPSAARWCATPRCSCSTSHCRTSMPSCASRCGWRSRSCTNGSGPPSSS
jgi:multiple sugar transport system ATP-binding protein